MKTTITQDLAEHENLASQCSSLWDVIRFSLLGRLVISYHVCDSVSLFVNDHVHELLHELPMKSAILLVRPQSI